MSHPAHAGHVEQSPQDIQRMQEYAAKHGDHEGYHSILVVVMLVFLIFSQFGLHYWKRYHNRSFMNITLIGLWIIPIIFSFSLGYIRMIIIWSVFSAITAYFLRKASEHPLQKTTPRQVYGWFYLVYRLCYGLAISGYSLFVLDFFFGISQAFSVLIFELPASFLYVGTLFLFYGLYFGVLGRDCAEVVTDRLASVMGYTGKGLPSKGLRAGICCVCAEAYEQNDVVELNCKHFFHEWCIRGWTMVGKKDTCPFCSEKVNLKQLFNNPWEKQGIMWAQLLDALRYMIVWNPVLLIAIQVFLRLVD